MVLGSPVYYASPSGELIAFLDRFYWKGEKFLRFKPAAAVTVARRAGKNAGIPQPEAEPKIFTNFIR